MDIIIDYAVGFHWITANVEHHGKLFLFTHFLYEGLEVIAFCQLIATPTTYSFLMIGICIACGCYQRQCCCFPMENHKCSTCQNSFCSHTTKATYTICRGLGSDCFLSVNCNSIVGWSGGVYSVDPLERADRSAREKGGNFYWKLFYPHTWVFPQRSWSWSPRTCCLISHTHAVQVWN